MDDNEDQRPETPETPGMPDEGPGNEAEVLRPAPRRLVMSREVRGWIAGLSAVAVAMAAVVPLIDMQDTAGALSLVEPGDVPMPKTGAVAEAVDDIRCPTPNMSLDAAAGLDTNLCSYLALSKAYYLAKVADPLALTSPVSVESTFNAVVQYGEPFGIGWVLRNPTPLPVEVSVGPASADLDGCLVTRTKAANAPVTASDTQYTLYPDLWVKAADRAGIELANQILVQVEGYAPTGTNGATVPCHIEVPAAASNGLDSAVLIVKSIVYAVPKPGVEVAVGTLEATDRPATVVATPAVPATLPIQGLGDEFTFSMSALTSFTETDDEWWDTDFMRVSWSTGTAKLASKTVKANEAKPFGSGSITLANGEGRTVCVTGTLKDDDKITYNDASASGQVCVSVSYTKLGGSDPPSTGISACDRLLASWLGADSTNPTAATECAAAAALAQQSAGTPPVGTTEDGSLLLRMPDGSILVLPTR